jgi:hypothetical protein
VSNPSNGHAPEVPRLGPGLAQKPAWFLDRDSEANELVIRKARIEGLRRALGDQQEDES